VRAWFPPGGSSSGGGSGPLTPPTNGSWSQNAWFISHATGSDMNHGTMAEPLKTYAELARRWGTVSPFLTTDVTITWLDDSPASDPVVCRPYLGDGGSIYLLGTLVQQGATGALSSVTAKNRSTPQQLNANLGVAVAPLVGFLVENTTNESFAWIDAVGGGGADFAVLTQPFMPVVQAAPTQWTEPTEVDSWANTNVIKIWRPTQVSILDYRPTIFSLATGVVFTAPAFLAHVWIPAGPEGVGGDQAILSPGGVSAEYRCDRFQLLRAEDRGVLGGLITNAWLAGSFESAVATDMGASNGPTIQGGAISTLAALPIEGTGCAFDGEVYCNAELTGEEMTLANVYISSPGDLSCGVSCRVGFPSQAGVIWGPGGIDATYGRVLWSAATATATFLLKGAMTFNFGDVTTASAYDASTGLWHGGRAITQTLLDTSIAGGGFGGGVDQGAVDPVLGCGFVREGT
jgi:hypothetical protein